MKQTYITCLLLLLASGVCSAQFLLQGVVRDSATGEYLPGVNVVVAHTSVRNETFTGANGAFSLRYPHATAEVQVSFIGYVTRTVSLDASRETAITLVIDQELLNHIYRKVRLRLDVGYYGDARYARQGVTAMMPLQGIGRRDWLIQTAFKYWRGDGNNGIDASISKHLGLPGVLPDNIFLSYRSFNYRHEGFHWTQYRALLVNYLPASFTLDVGAGYNQISVNNEIPPNDAWRLSGSIGLTKNFYIVGIHTNFNYTAKYPFFEAAAFKAFAIRKSAYFTATVKYYRYPSIEGVMLSLMVNLFNTQYFCCGSPQAFYEYFHVLK